MDDTRGGPAGTSKVVDNRVGERRPAPISSVLPEGVEGSELWRRRCLHPWRRTEHHGSFGHLIPPGGRSRHLCQKRMRLVGQRLQGALPCHIRAGLVGTTGNGPNPVIYDAHSSLAQLSRQQRTRFVSVVVGGALQPVCQAARAQAPDRGPKAQSHGRTSRATNLIRICHRSSASRRHDDRYGSHCVTSSTVRSPSGLARLAVSQFGLLPPLGSGRLWTDRGRHLQIRPIFRETRG